MRKGQIGRNPDVVLSPPATPKRPGLPASPSTPCSDAGHNMFSGKSGKPAHATGAPSIITEDVVMTGTLAAKCDLQIEGRIDGDVRCIRLVIGDAGQVNGNIFAEEVTIRGHVHGAIHARQMLLCRGSHVEGDIAIESFTVEAGAIFEGNCRQYVRAEVPNKVAEYQAALQVFAPAAAA